MNESKVEIKKIILKVNDKEISLSLEEAKELKKILDDTFWQRETIYLPSYPVYPTYTYPHWTVTYGSDTKRNDYCAGTMLFLANSNG